jgi:hypothetical protein
MADISRPGEGKYPTRVHVAILVVDLEEVNTASQRFNANVYLQASWRDQRLAHGGQNKLSRPLIEVWHPRIHLINRQQVWLTFPEAVEITPTGEVMYRQRVCGSFSQPLQLQDFPFDSQIFTIQLIAAGYAPDDVEFVSDPDLVSGITQHPSVADWIILGWNAEAGPFELSPGVRNNAGFALSLEAKRKVGYFIIKVIIPLMFIVAMSWVVFWIDPRESGTQISVAITTMLTLIAYRFAVGTSLPKVSYLTRLDYFILAATVLIFASLIEVVTTSFYAKGNNLARAQAIDHWSRWLFPAVFVLVVLGTLVFRVGI